MLVKFFSRPSSVYCVQVSPDEYSLVLQKCYTSLKKKIQLCSRWKNVFCNFNFYCEIKSCVLNLFHLGLKAFHQID